MSDTSTPELSDLSYTVSEINEAIKPNPYETARSEAAMTGTPYWVIALALELGYPVIEPGGARPDMRLYTLPMDPFIVIGRLVIVTHLILDAKGDSKFNVFGRRRRRHELRLLPRSPYDKS